MLPCVGSQTRHTSQSIKKRTVFVEEPVFHWMHIQPAEKALFNHIKSNIIYTKENRF